MSSANDTNGWIKVTYKTRRSGGYKGKGYAGEAPNYWKPEFPYHNQWQDWTPVRIDKKEQAALVDANGKRVKGGLRLAMRQQAEAQHMAKLAAAEGPMRPKKLTKESIQMIVALRAAQAWDQVHLNEACQFPVNTIREVEAGRLVPTIQQLNTLNRVLKTGLKLE